MEESIEQLEIAEQIQIIEDRPDHHYRTEIPNFLFDILTPNQLAVYSHLKRITGEGGKCWMSTKNLAKKVGIGTTSLKLILKELSQKDYFIEGSLIQVSKRKKEDGSQDTNIIRVLDIWRVNGDWHRGKKPKGGGSPNVGGVGRQTSGGGSPNVDKEQPSEEQPSKETNKQENEEDVVVCSSDEEKEAILRSYGLSKNLMIKFMQVELSIIKDAVVAFEQYKSKQEESGEKLENPMGALRNAIEKQWKPNVTKTDKEVAREQQEKDKSLIIKENRELAIEMKQKYQIAFNEDFNFSISSNAVTLKHGTSFACLSLLDPQFKQVLRNYIQNKGS